MATTNSQRKFCEECDIYFRYDDVDSTEEAKVCPVNEAHTVRDFVIEEVQVA